MTDKLSLYNGALLECGERRLGSLTENTEPRHLLDQVWNEGAIRFMLNAGPWKFATRTVELTASTDVVSGWAAGGYSKAYEIPADHVRTTALCSDPYLNVPLLTYATETGYFFTDVEPIYLSYVSDDAEYGSNFTIWPPDFILYAHAYLASRIIKKVNQKNQDRADIYALLKQRLLDAKNGDAMEGPTRFMPTGSWLRARAGGGARRSDRGMRNKLVG